MSFYFILRLIVVFLVSFGFWSPVCLCSLQFWCLPWLLSSSSCCPSMRFTLCLHQFIVSHSVPPTSVFLMFAPAFCICFYVCGFWTDCLVSPPACHLHAICLIFIDPHCADPAVFCLSRLSPALFFFFCSWQPHHKHQRATFQLPSPQNCLCLHIQWHKVDHSLVLSWNVSHVMSHTIWWSSQHLPGGWHGFALRETI